MSQLLPLTSKIGVPVNFVISGAALPGKFSVHGTPIPGLDTDLQTGRLTGTPQTEGLYRLTVRAAGRPDVLVLLSVHPAEQASPNLAAVPAPLPPPPPSNPVASRPHHPFRPESFFQLDEPCPVPGCAELRVQYKTALDKLNSSGCSGCQKAALTRKFTHEFRTLLACR